MPTHQQMILIIQS